ncbi:MAG: beta-propeller domain-containing protein [Bifidobacteriaceae bacterium]|jgi:uncharacterized secreted protein with C-terminal beta-propeller domain|nr:beta-propeller domain-containing protein [Bifidobacteriaceae bacterium]
MTDEIFRAMREQMKPSPELVNRLNGRLQAEALGGDGRAASSNGAQPSQTQPSQTQPGHVPPIKARRRAAGARPKRRRSTTWLVAAASVAAVALVGTVVYATVRGPKLDATKPAVEPVEQPLDYDAVYAALERTWQDDGARGGGWGVTEDSAAAPEAAAGAMDADAYTSRTSGQSDYTGTNVQVEGIDEGDIVKTDGETIFVASGTEVVLIKADGAATKEIARIDTVASTDAATDASADATGQESWAAISDLMLHGSTLAVVLGRTEYVPGPVTPVEEDGRLVGVPDPYWSYEESTTTVVLYDVSRPSEPRQLTSFGQDGSYQASRLADGKLYLVSNYWVGDESTTDPADPATFAPCLAVDDEQEVMAPSDLAIWEKPNGAEYVVMTAIDLGSRERISELAVLGGSEVVYMSQDNLYLASTEWEAEGLNAFLEQFGFSGGSYSTVTHLMRVSLADGQLALAAQGSVPGRPVDQFALDEYESNLRIATTVDGDWEGGTPTHAALFVLNQDLTMVGEIPELMRDESIQSVRYMGATGYVVTFRQTDPLFAIDLADPAAPQVMSALKIDGFSAYLHPWGEDRLVGLGYAGNATGLTGGMKLAVFDISDPFDVTVSSSLPVEAESSAALDDHRAVYADPARSMIGFPALSYGQTDVEWGYLVYVADSNGDFEPKASLDLTGMWTEDWPKGELRGLRVGDHFYVCAPDAVWVWGADFGDPVAKVPFEG